MHNNNKYRLYRPSGRQFFKCIDVKFGLWAGLDLRLEAEFRIGSPTHPQHDPPEPDTGTLTHSS